MEWRPTDDPPPCGWCGAPAVTDVITVPGRAGGKRRTAPVCESHAQKFEFEGQSTTRAEMDAVATKAKPRIQHRWGR
jgi:hypothetical protein